MKTLKLRIILICVAILLVCVGGFLESITIGRISGRLDTVTTRVGWLETNVYGIGQPIYTSQFVPLYTNSQGNFQVTRLGAFYPVTNYPLRKVH